jgi:quinoprotein glucose dehydrogenase
MWPIFDGPGPAGRGRGVWHPDPHPRPPPRSGHLGVALDDILDIPPELRAAAEALVADHLIGPIYTPPVPFDPNGPVSTLMVMGGSNWPGGAYDPDTNMVYVTASIGVNSMKICRYDEGSAMPHGICLGPEAGAFGGVRGLDVQGLPLLKPPYGTIAAIDLRRGALAWEVPNGDTPEEIAEHPALEGVDVGKTGRSGQPPGALATKTLLISAEPGWTTLADGSRGARLIAYDKATGRELAALALPAPQTGSPMTYLLDGV